MVWAFEKHTSKGQPYSVTVTVEGEEFEIATFNKNPKGASELDKVDFADNPHEDSKNRDLTINSMYIELSKSDGENNKLYDPAKSGYHDLMADPAVVQTVGEPEERFGEDKGRIMRALRFQSHLGKGGKLGGNPANQKKMMKAIERFAVRMDGVDSSRMRDEFLKSINHPDCDVKTYIDLLQSTKLMDKIFPGLDINSEMPEFRDKKDQALTLAWLLQNNDSDSIMKAMGNDESGWRDQDRNAISFLINLKGFSPDQLPDMMSNRKGAGLSPDQIRDWADMFNVTDTKGRVRNRRPVWAKMIKAFADHEPSIKPDEISSQFSFIDPMELQDLVGQKEIEAFTGKLMPKTGK